jgi:hypothetical protein
MVPNRIPGAEVIFEVLRGALDGSGEQLEGTSEAGLGEIKITAGHKNIFYHVWPRHPDGIAPFPGGPP